MRFLFRADASVQIGTGHVMRCITLAHELKRKGHQSVFVCREHTGHLGEFIVREGFELRLLPKPTSADGTSSDNYASWLGVSWQVDADETLEIAKSYRPDWLVIDHYALDVKWEVAIRDAVDQVMVIDDLANRSHDCDVLLDQNLGREALDYDNLVPDRCSLLVGPEFALLRPEFAALREASLQRRRAPQLKRVLISLGGVDQTNVTGQVLDVLKKCELPTDIELDIVMGASAPHTEEVRIKAEEMPFQATVSVNVKDIARRMCEADLAIGAAGSTSWERCCMGLASVTLIIAENQRFIAESLHAAGACLKVSVDRIGTGLSTIFSDIVLLNRRSLAQLSAASAAMCDGLGAERVVARLTKDD